MKIFKLVLIVAFVLTSTTSFLSAQDINYGGISINVGTAVPVRDAKRTDLYYELTIESRLPRYDVFDKYLFIRPMFGLTNSELHVYTYSGLEFNFVGEQITLSASFSFGYYIRKESSPTQFNLGFPLEFKEDVHFSWSITDKWLVKAGIYHLSNAGLGDINPGLEVIYFGIEFY